MCQWATRATVRQTRRKGEGGGKLGAEARPGGAYSSPQVWSPENSGGPEAEQLPGTH